MSAQPQGIGITTDKVSVQWDFDGGPRHRIGLIALDSDVVTEQDFHRIAARGRDVLYDSGPNASPPHGREPAQDGTETGCSDAAANARASARRHRVQLYIGPPSQQGKKDRRARSQEGEVAPRLVALPITSATEVARRSTGLTSGPCRGCTGGGAVVLATGLVELEIARFDELHQRWVPGRLCIDLAGLGGSQEELFTTGQRNADWSVSFVGDVHFHPRLLTLVAPS